MAAIRFVEFEVKVCLYGRGSRFLVLWAKLFM